MHSPPTTIDPQHFGEAKVHCRCTKRKYLHTSELYYMVIYMHVSTCQYHDIECSLSVRICVLAETVFARFREPIVDVG